ncbi:hypothetical protein AB4Y63_14745 [Leifsonia sp. YAF41]|uniref:hypothetical protein n=1 Tax=Leifsonia sp. YAF41 TaxID=3233086 RepID=UPI003F9DBBA9
MSTEQGTTSERSKEECEALRAERDILLNSVKNLTHSQLIGRDMELGLRAELAQAKISIEEARARGAHDLAQTRKSTTWKIGRLVMTPAILLKRVQRRIKK